MKASHQKLGKYSRVADHLYQYSVTKKYYVVFKFGGKEKWIPLNSGVTIRNLDRTTSPADTVIGVNYDDEIQNVWEK